MSVEPRHEPLHTTFRMQFIQLTALLLLGKAYPVDAPRLQAVAPAVLTSRLVWDTNGNCTGCDLCLASVGAADLLLTPVQRILETAAGVAAGVCNKVPGSSGKECYDITSVIAHALDLLLKGENVTQTCRVLGACNGTAGSITRRGTRNGAPADL